MQLVIGGAFSGKRKIVKESNGQCSLVSAYEGDMAGDWQTKWLSDTTLVMEGWEKWIVSELKNSKSNDEIRSKFKALFKALLEQEEKRNNKLVLIMLVVGKGIVPIHEDDRRLRDLAGWIAQDAAHLSNRVDVVWNGLSKRVK